MNFLDDIGPVFEPGHEGSLVNPIVIIIISIVIVGIIIATAIFIKKGKK